MLHLRDDRRAEGCALHSQALHAFSVALPDVGGFSEAGHQRPMFHVSAWGIPYAAALTGARLVLPGPRLQPAALAELIQGEGVPVALGVPTVWVGLIRYLRASAQRLGSLKRVIIGGAAAPPSLIDALQQEFGIEVRHAWGMTETSPLGTSYLLLSKDLATQASCGMASKGFERDLLTCEASPRYQKYNPPHPA